MGAAAVHLPPGSALPDSSSCCLHASCQAGSLGISVSGPRPTEHMCFVHTHTLAVTAGDSGATGVPQVWVMPALPQTTYAIQQSLHEQFFTGDFGGLVSLCSLKFCERELNKLLNAINLH